MTCTLARAAPETARAYTRPVAEHAVLLTRLYADFNARDVDAVLAVLDPDVDWPNAFEARPRARPRSRARVLGVPVRAGRSARGSARASSRTSRASTVVLVHQTVLDLAGAVMAEGRVEHVFDVRGGAGRADGRPRGRPSRSHGYAEGERLGFRRVMRTRLSIAVLAALAISGCALGDPKPTTLVTDTSATFDGDVSRASPDDTEYWWRYGEDDGLRRRRRRAGRSPSPTTPRARSPSRSRASRRAPPTTSRCASRTRRRTRRRVVCSTDRTFTTGPAGGRSEILFDSWRTPSLTTWVIDEDGTSQTQLTAGGPNEHASWSPDARRSPSCRTTASAPAPTSG